MRKLLIPFCLTFLVSSALASPQMFKHSTKGVSCEQCHGVADPAVKAKAKSCAQCHNYNDLARKSATINPNPHDSHAGQLRCTLCHREHSESVVYCKECHKNGDPKFNFRTP